METKSLKVKILDALRDRHQLSLSRARLEKAVLAYNNYSMVLADRWHQLASEPKELDTFATYIRDNNL